MTTHTAAGPQSASALDSRYAWTRLWLALTLGTIGSVGMWSFVVALPAVQADFGVARGDASLPFTLTMIGFGAGGIVMGRLADRFGIMIPVAAGALMLGAGYILSGVAANLWQFALAQGLIGFGASGTFGPLMTDISHWFARRRGIAVALASCGNYLAGAIWPPIIQYFISAEGWRFTQVGIGVICLVTMLPLVFGMRRKPPVQHASHGVAAAAGMRDSLGISSNTLMALLFVAGIACCVAMAMPQVHLVAYCGDLGHGAAHGAHMLALLLACGVVSRLTFGWISDRTGGLPTLLIGSGLQALALLLFLPFNGLVSLYAISALFGLVQGGIVPSYAMIVREYFSPREAGARVATVMMATVFGMALGGWLSGSIFDLTGSYRAAFINGVLWNVLNLSIAVFLLQRAGRRLAPA